MNSGPFSERGRGSRRFRRPGFRNQYRGYRKPTQHTTSELEISGSANQLSRAKTLDINPNKSSGPYLGWKLYIQDELFIDNSPSSKKLAATERFFKNNGYIEYRDEIEEKGSFNVDFKIYSTDKGVLEKWPNVVNEIQENPEQSLNILGLAMHRVLSDDLINEKRQRTGESASDILESTNFPKVIARVLNFTPIFSLRKMRSNWFGKFVCIKGTVVKASNVKPLCTNMAFECLRCRTEFVFSQPYGNYTTPVKCIMRDCRGQTFHPLIGSKSTETVDWQSIKLQEAHEDGQLPRSVTVELMYDLVDSCVPGDIVALSGIVKVTSSEMKSNSKPSKDKCTFLLYIFGNSVTNLKGTSSVVESRGQSTSSLELSMKDLDMVRTVSCEPNLFKLLVASLCPSIYGHEMVKAGLILTLFGGTQRSYDRRNELPIRGDPHILVVGDPGLGKSQMLQACCSISPRGIYVCGNTATTAGLTVTLSKESGNGEYTLEAGALVLADQGNCCIDEFDKMTTQHNALLEAMEQQNISIAKAGMVCSLPARTSIIAAANPIGGHYDKSRSVSENLRMGSALLSRFDLVFILLDKPNVELDCKLSEHIISLHSKTKEPRKISAEELNVSFVSAASSSSQMVVGEIEDEPLSTRLKYKNEEDCDPIPHVLLQKYVAYARKYVQPQVIPAAATILQQFYLELRDRLKNTNSTPITTRQLESLIRLTEARAKLELRDECTEKDAIDVVDIMKHSMIDVWSDEFGLLNIERSEHGSGMSARGNAKRFITALNKVSERTRNSLFSVEQMKLLISEIGIKVDNLANFLDSLNMQGYLLKKGPKIFKLLTTDY